MSEFQIPRRDELRSAWFRGYRKGDVEVALAQFGLTIEQQHHELDSLRRRAEDQDSDVRDLRQRLDSIHGKEVELVRQLEELGIRRAHLEREAEARARTVLVDAEQHASRLRTDALTQVGELQEQAQELLALRHNLVGTLKAAMDDIAELSHRLSTGSRPNDLAGSRTDPAPESADPGADEAPVVQNQPAEDRHGHETAFVDDLGPWQSET